MKRISIPRPFAGSYGAMLTIAILAISPFIVLTTAASLYRDQIVSELGAGLNGIEIISGLSTAGYAFGALLGGDLTQRLSQRTLFLSCEILFIIGCLLAAVSGGVLVYGAGRVLTGLATGMLLVSALPPVFRRFPPERLPRTATAVNIGFFGAVTIGPMIGGTVAYYESWRWFYAGLAGIGAGVFTAALFTLPDQKPFNPDLPYDRAAFPLAFAATVLPFWATGELTGHKLSSYIFAVPLAAGLACLIALLLTQYHKKEPLAPVKPMWHTYPLLGLIAASIGGGAFISLLMLSERYLIEILGRSPLEAGLAFWPQIAGVLITAFLLGALLRTRFLPLLTLAGMILIMAGGITMLFLSPQGSHAILLGTAGLLGLGAGATVAPGLIMASFSLPVKMVGRTIALVELVRSEADFILGPVMLQVASSGGAEITLEGLKRAIWVTILLTGATTLFGIILYLAGAGPRLPTPDLTGWLEGEQTAYQSPAIGAALLKREFHSG